jgi:hypothetical protein
MDTLVPQQALIDLQRGVLVQPLCENVTAPIIVKPRDDKTHKRRKLVTKQAVEIPPKTAMGVKAHAFHPLSPGYDYIMEPLNPPPYKARCYAMLLNANSPEAVVRNDTNNPVKLQKGAPLGHATPLESYGIYSLGQDEHDLAALPDLRAIAGPETKLPNGVTVYGDPAKAQRLAKVIMKYPFIWTDRGTTCRIPEDYWMPIDLKDGWQDANIPSRRYPAGPRDQAVIDKVFDKLTEQGKMELAQKPAPFPVQTFVVYRRVVTTNPDGSEKIEFKGRPVLDMREINAWVIKDAYPLTTQNDILQALQGANYITVVDGLSYFYQFNVRKDHRHRFTVNSHRGAEILNVCAMGYKNSVAHAQRCGDLMLKDLRNFAKAYIDDFVVYSKLFEGHLQHLDRFFCRMSEMVVTMAPEKAFVGYPSAKLLGQRVDAFGISSTDERIEALRNIVFPRHARDMERYVGAINFLNDRTPYLAQIDEPLTTLKTELLRHTPKKRGRERAKMAASIPIPADGPIREAFENIQSSWNSVFKRTHQDLGRPLYIDVDSSKELGMALMADHVKGDKTPTMVDSDIPDGYEDNESSPTAWLKRCIDFEKSSIEPIVFLF